MRALIDEHAATRPSDRSRKCKAHLYVVPYREFEHCVAICRVSIAVEIGRHRNSYSVVCFSTRETTENHQESTKHVRQAKGCTLQRKCRKDQIAVQLWSRYATGACALRGGMCAASFLVMFAPLKHVIKHLSGGVFCKHLGTTS